MERRSSTFSISSHTTLSDYQKLGNVQPTTQQHKFSMFKRVNPHLEKIVTDGNFVGKLEYPFRFTRTRQGNVVLGIWNEYQQDENQYCQDLDNLKQFFGRNCRNGILFSDLESCIGEIRAVCNCERQVLDFPDLVITAQVTRICTIYAKYFRLVDELFKLVKNKFSHDKKLVFEFQGLDQLLDSPLQRILEMRFFLFQCMKCKQHVCNVSNCSGFSCEIWKSLRNRCDDSILQLSSIIQAEFGRRCAKDSFLELILWESKIDTSTCMATKRKDDSVPYTTIDYPFPLELHLAAPFRVKGQSVTNIPVLDQTEIFFVGAVGSEKIVKGAIKIQLHLMNDTLIITHDIVGKQDKLELMYAPIPLKMTDFKKYDSKNETVVYTVKVSALKLLVLHPINTDTAAIFYEKFQNYTKQCTAHTIGKNGAQENYIPPHPASQIKSNILFSAACQPWVYKQNAEGLKSWVKTSKSTLSIEGHSQSATISLNMEVTHRTIAQMHITPDFQYKKQAPKKLSLIMFDSRFAHPYLISFQTAKEVDDLIYIFNTQLILACHTLYSRYKNRLVLQEFYKLNNDSSFLILNHSQILSSSKLSVDIGGWQSFGCITCVIIHYYQKIKNGIEACRLQFRSDLAPNIIFLDVEVHSKAITTSTTGSGVIIRVHGHQSLDYKLDILPAASSDFVSKLSELAIKGDEIIRKRQEKESLSMQEALQITENVSIKHLVKSFSPENEVPLMIDNNVRGPIIQELKPKNSKKDEQGQMLSKPKAFTSTETQLKVSNRRSKSDFPLSVDYDTPEGLRIMRKETDNLYQKFVSCLRKQIMLQNSLANKTRLKE